MLESKGQATQRGTVAGVLIRVDGLSLACLHCFQVLLCLLLVRMELDCCSFARRAKVLARSVDRSTKFPPTPPRDGGSIPRLEGHVLAFFNHIDASELRTSPMYTPAADILSGVL